MEPVIITSFCLGLIFGGIATAAVSINEIHRLRKISSVSNETPRSKLRGISTKDISNNNAASSGVFTLRENKKRPGHFVS